MVIDIPSHEERILKRYENELADITAKLNNEITYGTLQTNWKEHKWVVALWSEYSLVVDDELWDWLVKTYHKAGWLLEKEWGEEGSSREGHIIAVNCFKVEPAE